MEAELKRLGRRAIDGYRDIKPQRVDEQTLIYPYSPDLAWLVANHLRTPSRALWDIFRVDSRRLEPLYDELFGHLSSGRPEWMFEGARLSVRVKNVREFEAGPLQIRGTVKNAVIDAAQKKGIKIRLDTKHPNLLLSVRGSADGITLSIDLAGRGLHERGYRRRSNVPAPLRETVAAQLLILSRWDARSEILLDPLAGSGTIAIEGAAMALGRPLWTHDPPFIASLPGFADRPPCSDLFADAEPRIVANELSGPALKTMKANATRAGLADRVHFLQGDFNRLTRTMVEERVGPGGGLLCVNPPFGERLETEEERLMGLYRDLRAFWTSLGPGWRAAVIMAHPRFEGVFGRDHRMKKPVPLGKLPAHFYVYDATA